jgi:hypothetical protein
MVVQPALEPLRRWDPERIGPYVVLGRLGAGAMGQVFLGRSTAGRLVAVKTIKIEFAEEAGFRSRFAHEVAAARRVSGVFTAAVVAADADADVPWLATAYVPAPSLTELVRTCGPLPVPATRWLAVRAVKWWPVVSPPSGWLWVHRVFPLGFDSCETRTKRLRVTAARRMAPAVIVCKLRNPGARTCRGRLPAGTLVTGLV